MKTCIPGHIYDLDQLGGGTQRLVFVRRSGGAVQYDQEWSGLQTQEVLRALIDRTKYLYRILPCGETANALHHLRCALFEYEVRAWRRKREVANRTSAKHDDTERPRPWREYSYNDIPFNEEDIELRPVGSDGHIIIDVG